MRDLRSWGQAEKLSGLAVQTNLTATSGTISWNALAQPVKINSTNATYDALGRMVETGSGSTYQQYVFRPSGDMLAVYSASTTTLLKGTVPLPGGDTAIYTTAASGLSYIRHKNWLGSSVMASTWGHAIYSETSYAPFGETYNQYGTTDASFTGQDQDVVAGSGGTGVYDFLFRKYDPSAGRWLSPDPLGWAAVDPTTPQSLDRYAYVLNQPLTLTDPNGGCWVSVGDTRSYSGYGSNPVYQDWGYDDGYACYTPVDMLGISEGGGGGQSGGQSSGAGGGGAPNNGPSKPGFFSCTFTGKVGMSYLSTGLDAVGIIPGAGNVLHGIQFGAGVVSTGLAVFGDFTGAGLSATGQGLALAEKSATNIAVHGVELVPIAGNIVSAISTGVDIFGKEGLIANYKSCMAGTN